MTTAEKRLKELRREESQIETQIGNVRLEVEVLQEKMDGLREKGIKLCEAQAEVNVKIIDVLGEGTQ